MRTDEIDDIISKIKAVMAVYNRTLNNSDACNIWIEALEDYDKDDILRALKQWAKSEKFAPQPHDIVRMVADMKARKAPRQNYPSNSHLPPVDTSTPIMQINLFMNYYMRKNGYTEENLDALNKYFKQVEIHKACILRDNPDYSAERSAQLRAALNQKYAGLVISKEDYPKMEAKFEEWRAKKRAAAEAKVLELTA